MTRVHKSTNSEKVKIPKASSNTVAERTSSYLNIEYPVFPEKKIFFDEC